MTDAGPAEPEPPHPSLLRRLRPDLAPMRTSRDFRLLWGSGCVSSFGSFLTYVAVPLQIKQLTGSYLAVGSIGAVELLPLIVFGLWGGALADALDRRKLVLCAEAGLGLLSGLLLLAALLPHPLLWPIYLVAGLVAAVDGLQRPALDTLVPRIVAHEQLTAAFALISIYRNTSTIAGPALAGVVVAYAGGPATAYALDVATFAVSLLLLVRLRAVPRRPGPPSPRWRRSWPVSGTPGAVPSCSGPTWWTSPRCSSPSRTRFFRSWPTTCTPAGRSG